MKIKVDWTNHLIGFIATILGIFIGLNLDEKANENETQKRLDAFKQLIHDEIKLNVSQLDTLLNNSHKHELHLKFLISKNIDNNVLNCSQSELDSVNRVWFSTPFIINTEKISDTKFKVYFALTTFSFASQGTVWEAFKNTDLINHLDATEIAKLTRLYKDFEQYEKEIEDSKSKIMYLMDNRRIDKAISSLTLKDYLNRLMGLMFQSNLNVDQGLIELKNYLGDDYKTKYPEINLESIKKSKESIK